MRVRCSGGIINLQPFNLHLAPLVIIE